MLVPSKTMPRDSGEKRFGSQGYANEELVAEPGAAPGAQASNSRQARERKASPIPRTGSKS